MNKELSCRPGEGISMKQNHILVITSLLSILLITLHLTSDTIHARAGTPEAGGSTLIGVPVLAIWLYGTLLLNERRVGPLPMLALALPSTGTALLPPIGPGRRFSRADARSPPTLLFASPPPPNGV